MWENWCGEGIPRWFRGQRQKMSTWPLTGDSLGPASCTCWGTAWCLSDQGESYPCGGPFSLPPGSRAVIPSGLISLNWQRKQRTNRSCGEGKTVTGLLTLALCDWQRKNALMVWSSGVLESGLNIPVCWRFLFWILTALPHTSPSLLFIFLLQHVAFWRLL